MWEIKNYMKNISEIYKHKKSETAIFLGSGPSINNITPRQWKIIAGYDSWTMNNWMYHPFVPNFYHVEVKHYNHALWKKRKSKMGDKFKDTVFIINKDRQYLLDLIGKQQHIYCYKMNKINITNTPIIPKYTSDTDPNILTCNLNSSMTLLLELLSRFKYKKVIFFGVDLYDSTYFWTGKSEFGKVHAQWNKDHEGRKSSQQHNTAHIKDFIVWFSEHKMSRVGGKFLVGHKDTLLYPGLEYYDIN